MYFDLLNISNTLPSGLASLEAVQLVQSKIHRSNLRFWPVWKKPWYFESSIQKKSKKICLRCWLGCLLRWRYFLDWRFLGLLFWKRNGSLYGRDSHFHSWLLGDLLNIKCSLVTNIIVFSVPSFLWNLTQTLSYQNWCRFSVAPQFNPGLHFKCFEKKS